MGNNNSNYKNEVNTNLYDDYPENIESIETRKSMKKAGGNRALFITAIVLAIIAIAISAVTLVLLAKNQQNPEKEEKTENVEKKKKEADEEKELHQNEEETEKEELKKVTQPVKTMYVNCNDSLTLRKGPGTHYGEFFTIPAGEAIEFFEYAENGFARVLYHGTEGYVSAQYLSDTRPYVWNYNEAEVESFVGDVLYAYVNSINSRDVSILTRYLGGNAISDARNNHNTVTSVVDREEVLSVSCHSTKRISRTRVTVVRESTIRIYRKNGTIEDKYEKYLSTVENTGSGMRVIEFRKL